MKPASVMTILFFASQFANAGLAQIRAARIDGPRNVLILSIFFSNGCLGVKDPKLVLSRSSSRTKELYDLVYTDPTPPHVACTQVLVPGEIEVQLPNLTRGRSVVIQYGEQKIRFRATRPLKSRDVAVDGGFKKLPNDLTYLDSIGREDVIDASR